MFEVIECDRNGSEFQPPTMEQGKVAASQEGGVCVCVKWLLTKSVCVCLCVRKVAASQEGVCVCKVAASQEGCVCVYLTETQRETDDFCGWTV